MRIPSTPAVERALTRAAAWNSGDNAPIDVPEVLLALLAEPECRAAGALSRVGIDEPLVMQRWPGLKHEPEQAIFRAGQYSPALREALFVIRELLAERGEQELATEHLLWGLIAGDHETAVWLRERGLDGKDLEGEFATLCRLEAALPLPVEDLDAEEGAVADGDVLSGAGAETLTPALSGGGRGGGDAAEAMAVWRALDAAGNRAREGLRVVEDYLRFGLDDRHLTEQLKSLRHALSTVVEQMPVAQRLAARDTRADVGTNITLRSESQRDDAESVVVASLKRTGEALRSLEEFGKVVDPAWAMHFERLRYRLYTLEKAIGLTTESVKRLEKALLYVLLDGRESMPAFERLAQDLIAAGVDIVQLRDKQLSDRQLLMRGQALRTLTRSTDTLYIMNDRPDLAVLTGADGVHVGQDELTVKQTRQIVGPRMLVGVSTHSLAQAQQAVLDGANYIGVGPTFPSSTKQFTAFGGTELLRSVGDTIRLPAFAIGGITLELLDEALATGMCRVAVGAAITQSSAPGDAARAFQERIAKFVSANAHSSPLRQRGREEA